MPDPSGRTGDFLPSRNEGFGGPQSDPEEAFDRQYDDKDLDEDLDPFIDDDDLFEDGEDLLDDDLLDDDLEDEEDPFANAESVEDIELNEVESGFMFNPVVDSSETEGRPWSPPENPPTIIDDDDVADAAIGAGFGLRGTEVELDDDLIEADEDYPEMRDVPKQMELGDDELARRVLGALRRDATTAGLRITVDVEEGIVALSGEVPTIEDSDNAEEVALEVPGVEEVVNDLEVAEM